MAFISKEEVKAKSQALKAVNKKYGIKATFGGSNSSTLKLTIASGKIDFIENFISTMRERNNFFDQGSIEVNTRKSKYIQVNHYYMQDHFSDEALNYLQEVYAIMNQGHWDKSDIQTDYFNCSWYNSIHIGRWNKPYTLEV